MEMNQITPIFLTYNILVLVFPLLLLLLLLLPSCETKLLMSRRLETHQPFVALVSPSAPSDSNTAAPPTFNILLLARIITSVFSAKFGFPCCNNARVCVIRHPDLPYLVWHVNCCYCRVCFVRPLWLIQLTDWLAACGSTQTCSWYRV